MGYLLDADVFIRAKNLHYGFDFCPAFWDWIIAENGRGELFTIEKVGNELHAIADELSDWADARGKGFFLSPDESVLPTLTEVSHWVRQQKYTAVAVNEFLQVADYYLVAQALAGKHTVVTHEIPSASVNKIKIPDVCIGLKIKCVTPYEMLRRERARFILGPHK